MRKALSAIALLAAIFTGINPAARADIQVVAPATGAQVEVITPAVTAPATITNCALIQPVVHATAACPACICGPSEVAIREAELRQRISDALACGAINQCIASALYCQMDKIHAQMECFAAKGCITYVDSRLLYKNWDKVARAFDDAAKSPLKAQMRIAQVRLLTL